MAAVMRAQDPMVSLFEPSIQHPDSNVSFLSFSALADFDLQQEGLAVHNNTWPGAQNWKMGDLPVYQTMQAPEAFELNDYYSLDSPQSCLAVTPSEHSTPSHLTCDAGSIAPPPQHRASNPIIHDPSVYNDFNGGADDQHIFSSGGCSSLSLNSKASHASFASSTSGNSDYLLTPRHSLASNPQCWGSMSLPSGSPSQYPEQWSTTPSVKTGGQQARQSIWPTESVGDMIPLADYVNYVGEDDGNVQYVPPQLSYRGSVSSRRQSGSLPPISGRNLSSTYDVVQTEGSMRCENGIAASQPSLLPAASIVGNVQGWQSSSPTYPSLLDYEEAANGRGHLGEPIAYPAVPCSAPKARPSGLASAYLSVPQNMSLRRSRSTDSVPRQSAARTKTLFAFHPVDETLQHVGNSYDPIDAAAQQYPLRVVSSGLSSRRTPNGLEVQIPPAPGMPSFNRAHSQPSTIHTPVAVTPPPHTVSNESPAYSPYSPYPPYSPYEAPLFAPAVTPYAVHHGGAAAPAPPVQPSVLASAPGGIHIAPPLSFSTPRPVTPLSVAEPVRQRTESVSRRAPPPPILTCEPLSMPERSTDVQPCPGGEVRSIAKLPASRKASSSKPRKTSASKRKASAETGISFDSFINYTAKDAAVISAGVAPSGSKAKRRSEDEGDQSHKRVRSIESA